MAVARRPDLWWTALRQALRLAPARWWARAPHLPVPPSDYLAFRLETQYGESRDEPRAEDVVHYLAWCRQWQAR